jgi:hypothetical protein
MIHLSYQTLSVPHLPLLLQTANLHFPLIFSPYLKSAGQLSSPSPIPQGAEVLPVLLP